MTDTNSYTALAWAAAWADKKDIAFLEALANHSQIKLNQQDSEGYTALGRAAEMGRWALHSNVRDVGKKNNGKMWEF